MLVSSVFEPNSDILCYCDLPKPILVKEEEAKLHYRPIEKYSFFEDDETKVK